jgi:hypothetical protein
MNEAISTVLDSSQFSIGTLMKIGIPTMDDLWIEVTAEGFSVATPREHPDFVLGFTGDDKQSVDPWLLLLVECVREKLLFSAERKARIAYQRRVLELEAELEALRAEVGDNLRDIQVVTMR